MSNKTHEISLRAIDLFAGCGGLSLGFQNVGFKIVAAFDNWEPAIQIYRKNFLHEIYNCDLGNLNDYNDFTSFKPDIIISGPPCQDFSSVGKRNENLGRGDLSITFAKIIASVKPKWFVMENVDRFQKSQKYNQVINIFKNSGYGLTEKIINAAFCGVPQSRKRYFCIGELNGIDNALIPYINYNLSKEPTTIRHYLGNRLGLEYYYRHPRTYQRRGIFSIDEPSPTIRGVNRPIPKTYKLHPGDAAPLTPDLRPLTTIERSYIQTFPKSFDFDEKSQSKTDLEQMIANAVPVKLAEFFARCLLQYMKDNIELNVKQMQSTQLVPSLQI
ncbi:DNA (cytosine-5-)-methyltransferase [Calothrix sp. HK-06]|nr:DNA (cytosine-5-)-methyltransferase [Calothrix sp. HK-06]